MVRFTLSYAEQQLRDANQLFQQADDPYELRWAAHKWLAGAMIYIQESGLPTFPAQELMRALEGLEQGRSSPIFKVKEGTKAGGREGNKAELIGEALACVDAFVKAGWPVTKAIGFTAASLGPAMKLDDKQLANIRKKVGQETAKNKPERYKTMIAARDAALAEFTKQVGAGRAEASIYDEYPNLHIRKLWEATAFQRLILLEDNMNIEH